MSRPRLVAALALSTTLVLAGCGGDSSDAGSDSGSDETSSAPEVAGATGPELSTDAFSFNAPEGWEQNTEAAPGALVFAADPNDGDGFADNVNVIEDPTLARAGDNGDIEDGVTRSLEAANAEDVAIDGSADMDGTEAVIVSSVFSLNDVQYAVRQYAVKRDDTGYIVTFSYSLDRPADEQTDIASSVIASWAWAS